MPQLLSPREHEILALIAEGRTDKEISVLLGMAKGTLKSHLASIFRKLDVHSRASAIAKWLVHAVDG